MITFYSFDTKNCCACACACVCVRNVKWISPQVFPYLHIFFFQLLLCNSLTHVQQPKMKQTTVVIDSRRKRNPWKNPRKKSEAAAIKNLNEDSCPCI